MPYAELDHERIAIFRAMSGDRADKYIGQMLLPSLHRAMELTNATIRDTRIALENPYQCLCAIYGHYAFARRGKDRSDLTAAALKSLRQTCGTGDSLATFLLRENALPLWQAFESHCPNSRSAEAHCGIVAGMAELSQELYKRQGIGSIAKWVVQGVQRTRRVEPQFMRMVDVRGIGPKTVSVFLRDMVYLHGLEEIVDHADRLFLVPIDKWARAVAEYVIDEDDVHEMPDWVLAGKISKYARRAGVSAVKFTMGTTYFGIREVRDVSNFERAILAAARPQFTLQ